MKGKIAANAGLTGAEAVLAQLLPEHIFLLLLPEAEEDTSADDMEGGGTPPAGAGGEKGAKGDQWDGRRQANLLKDPCCECLLLILKSSRIGRRFAASRALPPHGTTHTATAR